MPGNAGDVALEPSSVRVWFASVPRGAQHAAAPCPTEVSLLPLAASGSCPAVGQPPGVTLQTLAHSAGENDLPQSAGDVCDSVCSAGTGCMRKGVGVLLPQGFSPCAITDIQHLFPKCRDVTTHSSSGTDFHTHLGRRCSIINA